MVTRHQLYDNPMPCVLQLLKQVAEPTNAALLSATTPTTRSRCIRVSLPLSLDSPTTVVNGARPSRLPRPIRYTFTRPCHPEEKRPIRRERATNSSTSTPPLPPPTSPTRSPPPPPPPPTLLPLPHTTPIPSPRTLSRIARKLSRAARRAPTSLRSSRSISPVRRPSLASRGILAPPFRRGRGRGSTCLHSLVLRRRNLIVRRDRTDRRTSMRRSRFGSSAGIRRATTRIGWEEGLSMSLSRVGGVGSCEGGRGGRRISHSQFDSVLL